MWRLIRRLAKIAGTRDQARLEAALQEAQRSHAALPAAQARIAELEQAAEKALDGLIATARQDHTVTPAMEEGLRRAFAARQITLKGSAAWLSMLPNKADALRDAELFEQLNRSHRSELH